MLISVGSCSVAMATLVSRWLNAVAAVVFSPLKAAEVSKHDSLCKTLDRNETNIHIEQGLVNVPFWEYWTSPKIVAIIDHIPNGWVMFNGDI